MHCTGICGTQLSPSVCASGCFGQFLHVCLWEDGTYKHTTLPGLLGKLDLQLKGCRLHQGLLRSVRPCSATLAQPRNSSSAGLQDRHSCGISMHVIAQIR